MKEASDHIKNLGAFEHLLLKAAFSQLIPTRLRKKMIDRLPAWSRKKYGFRHDLLRAYIAKAFGIRVGKYTYGFEGYVGKHSKIIEIGAFTSIAKGVSFSPGNHPVETASTHPFFYHADFGFTDVTDFDIVPKNGGITIGNDVWIGMNATILTGVNIGDGAIIAANALVTKDVPPYAVVGGVPAKILKYRFNEPVIAKLKSLEWWLWDDEKIRQKLPEFRSPEAILEVNGYRQ